MTHIIVFNIVLLGACLYAFGAGGAPERTTALVFLLAAGATYIAPYKHYQTLEVVVLGIDVLTFVALVLIALCANRFWPLYIAALQMLTVAVHGVKAYQPSLMYWMYNAAVGKIAYPILVLLVIGVLRHRRRIGEFGSDRDWFRHRIGRSS